MRNTEFYRSLEIYVKRFGGYHNAHLHLDRAFTDEGKKGTDSHLSLAQKHARISAIHQSAYYEPKCLEDRLTQAVNDLIYCQTRRADSVIDTTDDGIGLRALEVARKVARRHSDAIDFRIGAYSPLGFRKNEQAAWDLLERGAEIADFIGCLPEKDDVTAYPDHIGYAQSCRRMVDLAHRFDTFLHVHTDQMNSPHENGTEILLDVLDENNPFSKPRDEPRVWAVHVISPSAYEDDRWDRLVTRLKEANVGVICCPSGALGMRQLRHERAPTHNSIARVLELCAAGIPVRLGNDNCGDMLSPSTTVDLTDEIFLLSAALRFYDTEVLAHLACGVVLSEELQERVRQLLEAEYD